MSIVLYELRGANDERYSLFSWRTRMALLHKGLGCEIETVLMHDKEAIAFSGGKTVPVLRDGETVLRDSWAIAEHLERTYPERPSLFGDPAGHALTHFLNFWADRSLVPLLAPMIAADIHERADPADQGFFRSYFEGFLKAPLEAHRSKRDATLPVFRRALEPARASLKLRPYLAGETPAYADYILFSLLQWARIASPFQLLEPSDSVAAWFERMLDLYEGYGRAHPPASAQA